MASIKLLHSGVATLALMVTGGGAAWAQDHDQSYLLQADLNVAVADYRADRAACNSRFFGRVGDGWGRSAAAALESRACTAEASADYYDVVVRIKKRYGAPYQSDLATAYNHRSQAIKLERDADMAQCNTRLGDTFNRSRDWQDRLNDGARAQQCRANAEKGYLQDRARLEKRYVRAMQSAR